MSDGVAVDSLIGGGGEDSVGLDVVVPVVVEHGIEFHIDEEGGVRLSCGDNTVFDKMGIFVKRTPFCCRGAAGNLDDTRSGGGGFGFGKIWTGLSHFLLVERVVVSDGNCGGIN
jgi:hypothetical protein